MQILRSAQSLIKELYYFDNFQGLPRVPGIELGDKKKRLYGHKGFDRGKAVNYCFLSVTGSESKTIFKDGDLALDRSCISAPLAMSLEAVLFRGRHHLSDLTTTLSAPSASSRP